MHSNPDPETGPGLVRGILAIVLAGAALGVAFNLLLIAGGARQGLAWVRVERPIASLEALIAAADSVAVDSAAAEPAAATSLEPGAGSAGEPYTGSSTGVASRPGGHGTASSPASGAATSGDASPPAAGTAGAGAPPTPPSGA
jgi:hypothetical protein